VRTTAGSRGAETNTGQYRTPSTPAARRGEKERRTEVLDEGREQASLLGSLLVDRRAGEGDDGLMLNRRGRLEVGRVHRSDGREDGVQEGFDGAEGGRGGELTEWRAVRGRVKGPGGF
jgi:hypothetical protein